MLVPLSGFISFIILYFILAVILLNIIPAFEFSKINVLIFIFGAWVGNVFSGYIYTQIFADANNQLTSTAAVVGFFITILISGISGGMGGILLGKQIVRAFASHFKDQ